MALAAVLHLAFRRAAKQPRKPSWEELRAAFARAEAITQTQRKAIVLQFPTPPPPHKLAVRGTPILQPTQRRTLEQEELLLQEINGCKALLLEIVRRAAYDWVLYRGSSRILHKTLAEQAFHWLFLESPNTSEWREREKQGKYVTSFVGICDSLGLDVDLVRKHIKRLTPKNVLSVGRPAENRRREVFSSNREDVFSLPKHLVDLEEVSGEGDDESGGNNFGG
jgi:hypothetical protein